MHKLDIKKDIKQYPMPKNQYMEVVTGKNQIVLHGTAGNAQAKMYMTTGIPPKRELQHAWL